jgi:predicted dehydrogenase
MNENQQPFVLTLGAGSAGKRHARNFANLGCKVWAFDPRQDRITEAKEQAIIERGFTRLDEALEAGDYSGIAIASPPRFHAEHIQLARERALPVLCEKPLALAETETRALTPHLDHVLLTYTYRWWPPVIDLRKRIEQGAIGKPLSARFLMSAHLEDWHPWERYQDFFMACASDGGGALLDESHFIDLLLWIFGRPEWVWGDVAHVSTLEIETDDCVELIAGYSNGLRANLHLDLVGRPHAREIVVTGERGTLAWSYEENALRWGREPTGNWERTSYSCERNDMFIGAAREFVAMMKGSGDRPSCTIADGAAALKIADAARQSAREGKRISLNWQV